MSGAACISGVKSILMGASVKTFSNVPCLPIPLVGQELKKLLLFYFEGSLKHWENSARLQKDRALRILTDAEQIPTTGIPLWEIVLHQDMERIRDEIGALHVVVDGEERPGWLVHVLKCWCGFDNPRDKAFKTWPKIRTEHRRRAIREYGTRVADVVVINLQR